MAVSPLVFRVVTAVVLVVSATFCCLSTAGNYWIENKSADIHEGLWQNCKGGVCKENDGGGKTCD